MKKHQVCFYLLLICCVSYEYLCRPMLELENSGLMGTLQYQILFQLMIGTLGIGCICCLELYFEAVKFVKHGLYTITWQVELDNNVRETQETRKR